MSINHLYTCIVSSFFLALLCVAQNKPEINSFRFNFREFDSPEKYAKAVEKIKGFMAYTKEPFKVPDAVFYNPALSFQRTDSLLKKKALRLDALRYYIDPTDYNLPGQTEERQKYIDVGTRLPYEYLYQPFYLLQHEVTNKEYREFVYYVKDSIARTLLAESKLPVAEKYGSLNEAGKLVLNWKTKIEYSCSDDAYLEVLQPLYVQEGERSYNRKEVDSQKLNYMYVNKDSSSNVTNIYPDTLAWLNDFDYTGSFPTIHFTMEMRENLYFWHPAYDDYPVVGLSFMHVKAFLHWKTQKLQRELDKQKLPFVVEYDLPNEMDMEMVRMEKLAKPDIKSFVYSVNEKSWLHTPYYFDLNLVLDSSTKTRSELPGSINSVSYLLDHFSDKTMNVGISSIFPTRSPKKWKNTLDLNSFNNLYYSGEVPFINGNVSEWMSESFTANDSIIYYQRNKTDSITGRKTLSPVHPPQLFPVKGNFEDFYVLSKALAGKDGKAEFAKLKNEVVDIKGLTGNCRLVRGANWMDCGDLTSGLPKQNFASVHWASHSTLGFRYVVRFKEKTK